MNGYMRRVLKVFLASPSDLQIERRDSKEVVDLLNNSLREVDVTVELLGWEDQLPGFGRPQAQINQDVDACDLFVGLLWKRWGTPPGVADSGFQEEFERALKRREKTGEPEIWIFFKEMDADQLHDPGKQLSKVIAFKEKLIREKKVLYSTFEDPSSWREKFLDSLLRYVFQHHESFQFRESEPKTGHSPLAAPTITPGKTDGKVPEQIQSLLRALATESSGDLGVFQSAENIGMSGVARLFLLGASWVSYLATSEPLSNHAAQLIFRFRDEMELTFAERALLISSMINNGNQYVPGWYWLKDAEEENVESGILSIAKENNIPTFRAAAIKFLTARPRIARDQDVDNALIDTAIQDGTKEVVFAALGHAAKFGGVELIDKLEAVKKDPAASFEKEAELAIQSILMRSSATKAIDRMLAAPSVDRNVLVAIESDITSVKTGDLQKGLFHKDVSVRALMVRELTARNVLSKEDANVLLNDHFSQVRSIAIRRLIALGQNFEPSKIRKLAEKGTPFIGDDETWPGAEQLIREQFETYSFEELEAEVMWISTEGPIAYGVLASKHFDR